ncbi:agamous-like MADS-box protein AGL6 [Syzygium oleosum]|uniref:agamous-like MADS-box protein AGL6 n=1 Tax=Syzygium oleosum TaxID=219896 RepID=UPI0024B8E940|nr:agamous-like MADS-box protein AGL6 [Syzygium oleosum]
MGKRRRTEIAKIADPAKRLVTYSKRRKGLFKKASDLCTLCGARVAVIVFSPAGKLCSFGDPSAEEVISEYICGGSGVAPPMGLAEWLEWIESEWESSATEEDVESLIAKYEAARDLVRKRLEDLEKNSSVNISASADSGTGVGCNSENLSDQEIDLVLEGFKARCPALFEDCLCDGDGHTFLTSPEKSAAAGGSLGVDSTATHSDLEGCGINPDDILNLFGDCVGDGDHNNMLTLPENSAISGDESMLCELEECTFDPDEFLSLFKNCGGDNGSDCFLTLPENSANGGGSSGEEVMLYDLHECGFNPDEFLCLEEDFVGEANRDNFSTLPENSAIGGEILRAGNDADHFLTLEDLDVPL